MLSLWAHEENRAEAQHCVGSGGVSPAPAPRDPPLKRRPETPCKGHAQGGASGASRRIGFGTEGEHTIGRQRLAAVQWGGGAGEYDTCLSTRGGGGEYDTCLSTYGDYN